MNRKILLALAAGGALVGALALSGTAQATGTWGVPVKDSAACPNASGWYVNPDEAALAPQQKPDGFLFDGPSLVHRELASGIDLADVHAGSFSASLKSGVLPLFKMETTAPYTTINQTPDGKFWATAMLADDPGGMNHPVAHVTDLIGLITKPGKRPLTSATKVTTFGVGYASDTGNIALVKSITFHGVTYPLFCQPPLSTVKPTGVTGPKGRPTATPTATNAKPTLTPSSSPTAAGHAGGFSPRGPSLPVTGSPVGLLAGAAALAIVSGVVLFFVARRRKVGFTA
jgi:hypothetical protein